MPTPITTQPAAVPISSQSQPPQQTVVSAEQDNTLKQEDVKSSNVVSTDDPKEVSVRLR
jgi:hypothetical protein